ncbi:MAG: Succinyl-diaminopimelate desuccinylase [Chlamydiae bacterium]|nr:Succinyl-diaminopimelate desuccinylase [Chlamydiota bacterium]
MLSVEQLKEIFQREKEEILEDFFTFLRFKSIATDPAYKNEVVGCADWIKEYLEKIGLTAEKWETEGSPVIFASDLRAGPEKETLLLYGHYDVQPVDPIELWTHPPFEPTLVDGDIYARGASDNKGQSFYTIRAIKTLLEELGQLPINLKILIEGEEESGSAHLPALLEEKSERLQADHTLIVDMGFYEKDQPAIILSARGLVAMTITLTGSKFDLHSGMHGGLAYNPNRALVELLASFHDDSGTVTIPGFYDEVAMITPSEKSELDFDFDVGKFESQFGAKATGMERGVDPFEATCLRPTLEINGIAGGYAGNGFKTVIPAKATAKISCRLVPDQHPNTIAALVETHIRSRIPDGITVTIDLEPGRGAPFRYSPHSRIAEVMTACYSQIFQKPCRRYLSGGSIPITPELAKHVKGDIVLVGVALPDDKIHAPDEHFGLDRLEQGYLILCRSIELLGEK